MGSILTGQNLFIEALRQIQFRSNNTLHLLDGTTQKISHLTVIEQNIATCFHDPIALLFLLTAVIGFVFIWKYNIRLNLKFLIPMMFIISLPFIWYIIVSQHSITHSHMTYRNLTISIFAILCTYIASAEDLKKHSSKVLKQ